VPKGYKPYPGGHFLSYDLADGRFEDLGIAAYRDAAVMAARVMEYRRAASWIADGLRYADAIEQSHCRHVIGATSALVAWAGGEWGEAAAAARQSIADQGSRRAVTTARWAVGYVALGRGDILHAPHQESDSVCANRRADLRNGQRRTR
jgi:hypothetical protein